MGLKFGTIYRALNAIHKVIANRHAQRGLYCEMLFIARLAVRLCAFWYARDYAELPFNLALLVGAICGFTGAETFKDMILRFVENKLNTRRDNAKD